MSRDPCRHDLSIVHHHKVAGLQEKRKIGNMMVPPRPTHAFQYQHPRAITRNDRMVSHQGRIERKIKLAKQHQGVGMAGAVNCDKAALCSSVPG